MKIKNNLPRCHWPLGDDLMITYHDKEWGTPVHSDKLLYEYFVLDAFQAGLSWRTILHKRKNFKKAFSNFDFKKISKYGVKDKKRLLNDAGIIRNKLKIESAIINANKFLEIRKEFGTFDKYIWSFTKGKTIHNSWKDSKKVPAKTKLSDEISLDLKKRGFKFVGSTIIYAFMQAAGIVNDHSLNCFRYKELKK
jgi:DNA-3-methyladenine glycosylase I